MEYFSDAPGVLRVEADVASGWRRLTHTHGFCGRIIDDSDFAVQVAVRAWPNRIGNKIDEFPLDMTARFSHNPSSAEPLMRYELGHGRLVLHISLPDSQRATLPKANRRGFYSKYRMWGPQRLGYWLIVLAYFLEPARHHPDIFEFDTQFWQGGLPELGRR
jgi:hypothetical protein